MTEELLQTPLKDFHTRHGARLVPFGAWALPVQYTGIIEEHLAVREAAGLFDVSHMGEAVVTGPGAAAFLDRLLTNAIGNLGIGQARYSLMCRPDGGTIDDLIVYRRGPEDFFICLNAANTDTDMAWMETQAGDWPGARVTVENVSGRFAQLALQGPRSMEILARVSALDPHTLPRMGWTDAEVAGCPNVMVARTGYTGEDGVELYLPPSLAPGCAERIWEVGQSLGLRLSGLGARDSLRLEAGYPLYGHELSETITPLQAGLGWAVKWDKPGGFIGQSALQKEKATGPTRRLIHFILEDRRIARAGTPVLNTAGTEVGAVCSGTLSPVLNRPIGSALIAATARGQELSVDLRGHRAVLRITKPPLHGPR